MGIAFYRFTAVDEHGRKKHQCSFFKPYEAEAKTGLQ